MGMKQEKMDREREMQEEFQRSNRGFVTNLFERAEKERRETQR
jgi:hypothetical protein